MRAGPRVALFVVAFAAVGCFHYRAVPPAARTTALNGRRPVRVVLRNGDALQLNNARLIGDSVIGSSRLSQGHERVAVANADVAFVETLRFSGNSTGLAILAAGTIALGIYLLFNIGA
jgi:hypothetical protein